MKFTLSTKPLVTAANLVIINSNVTKFYHKSIMVELTATQNKLLLNTEATSIVSEVKLSGVGTSAEEARIFVDALTFKQLLSTIKTAQVELEFTDNALIINCGKSSFSLPKLADAKDGSFTAPVEFSEDVIATANSVDLSKWKFIKDHQMYAKAESYTAPVYTYVWAGSSGDALVGDYNNSIFTHSKSSQMETDCLLSETIINLVTSLPENTKIVKSDDTYVLYISADSYEYRSQITPVFESEDNGNYNAQIIMSIMEMSAETVKIDGSEIITAINQSALLTVDKNPKIDFTVDSEGLHLKDKRVNVLIPIEGTVTSSYTLSFKPNMLKSVISNSPDTQLELCPRIADDEVVGIIVHSKDYTAVLAGSEE